MIWEDMAIRVRVHTCQARYRRLTADSYQFKLWQPFVVVCKFNSNGEASLLLLLKKIHPTYLSQPFFIILTFSRLKHRNYVSSTTRVSESTHCKVVAPVSARSASVAELKTASISPALAKRVGQINNFYWSVLTVWLLTKSRVYILAIK